jgi:peptidoglycan/xylan/chitin deacetylase (PgdA/CDA1 family)
VKTFSKKPRRLLKLGARRPAKAAAFLLLCLVALPAHAYVAGRFYTRGPATERQIALTFDDGPGPITPALLELLKKHNARATFFMEGTQIERYSKIVRLVRDAGHEIGNHTYVHFNYRNSKHGSPARLVHELKQAENSLRRALKDPGFRTRVVRMPYGYFNRTWLLPTLKAEGYALVHWSYVHEKPGEPPEIAAQFYIDHAKPGAIFLFHDGGRRRERMLSTVTLILEALDKQGYRFVASEDMFKGR